MSAVLHVFHGGCHCGNVAFTFRTPHAPAQWSVRACQCRFCRAHGAHTTADPDARVSFEIAQASKLRRYRFETQSADFLLCGVCGVYVAAVLTTSRGQFATLNVNTIQEALDAPAAQPVSYDGESVEARRTRRERRWTPVTEAL